MARKKDLGGLAALAGLAYMASRDKAAKGDVPTGDDQYNPDVKQRGPDLGEIRDETGALSKLRRNTETGELYSPNEPVTRPAAATRSMSRPVAKGVSTAGNAGYDTTAMRPQPPQPGNTEAGMRNYVPRRSAAQQIAGRDDTYNPSVSYRNRTENKDIEDLTYKKGGKVKGWGSARGARKAKIY